MTVRVGAAAIIGLAAIGLCYSRVHAQPSPAQQQETMRSVWDGVYTDAQSERGKSQYSQHCAECHGEALDGQEMIPPLTGNDFIGNWNGLTAGDLFERIHNTMPLSKPGSLGREVDADILAYIFSINRFPSGKTELAHDAPVLKQILIQAFKPDKDTKGDKSN
jgi:mono/diheme cytochrome c family protein